LAGQDCEAVNGQVRNSGRSQLVSLTSKSLGFSLLEMLLALTLMSLLMFAVIESLSDGRKAWRLHADGSAQDEVAALAFAYLSASLRQTGALGCVNPQQQLINRLPISASSTPEYFHPSPIQIFDDMGGAADMLGLPVSRDGVDYAVHFRGRGIRAPKLILQQDMLVSRYMLQPSFRLAADAPLLGPWSIDSSRDSATSRRQQINQQNVLLISDCRYAVTVKATQVRKHGDRLLVSGTLGVGAFDNAALPQNSGAQNSGAQDAELENAAPVENTLGDSGSANVLALGSLVGLVQSDFFFLAKSTRSDAKGAVVGALWLKSGSARPQELVRGVSALQLLFVVRRSCQPNMSCIRPYNVLPAKQIRTGDWILGVWVTLTVDNSSVAAAVAQPTPKSYQRVLILGRAVRV
tara:strand:+ start:7840 stop:9060 length:1221 start_codon:yes stop_codon:yes gene_type:complete